MKQLRGRLMFLTLLISLAAVSLPAVSSLPSSSRSRRASDWHSENRCGGCLPEQLVGSLRVNSGSDHTDDDGGVELAVDIDLGKGLMVIEPVGEIGEKNAGNDTGNDEPKWSLVVDINPQSSDGGKSSPEVALYAVDHSTNEAWLLGSTDRLEPTGSRNRRRRLHRYKANGCVLKNAEYQHLADDGLGLMYKVRGNPLEPSLLLTVAADTCLPTVVSDSSTLTKLAFVNLVQRSREAYTLRDLLIYRLLASSSKSCGQGSRRITGLEALMLRDFLRENSGRGNGEPVLPEAMTKAARILIFLLFLDREQTAPQPTCAQLQWQATVSNTVNYKYKVGLQKSGTQETYIPRLYVDGVGQRVSGNMSDVVGGQLTNNITFLVTYNSDRSYAVIYIMQESTGTCFADNVTDIPTPPLTTYVRSVTIGTDSTGDSALSAAAAQLHQMTLDVYQTVYSQNSFNGTVDYYINSEADVAPDAFGRRSCVMVARTYSWASVYEQVTGFSTITYSTFGIADPDTVFSLPAACNGVPVQQIAVSQARDVYNSVMSYVLSVI